MNPDLATTRCMPAMTNLRITKIRARQRGVALLLMLLVVLFLKNGFYLEAINRKAAFKNNELLDDYIWVRLA